MLWEPNIVLVFFCGAAYVKAVFVSQQGRRSLFLLCSLRQSRLFNQNQIFAADRARRRYDGGDEVISLG